MPVNICMAHLLTGTRSGHLSQFTHRITRDIAEQWFQTSPSNRHKMDRIKFGQFPRHCKIIWRTGRIDLPSFDASQRQCIALLLVQVGEQRAMLKKFVCPWMDIELSSRVRALSFFFGGAQLTTKNKCSLFDTICTLPCTIRTERADCK